MGVKEQVLELIAYAEEQEWFEFKENWFEPEALGEYIAALSNAAALLGKKYAYMVWGIQDITQKIVGTTFNPHIEYNREPLQHYLARNLSPSVNFTFFEDTVDGNRVVMLQIPAAQIVPTAFKNTRFIRIGSSKCNLIKYPLREQALFKMLAFPTETIENTSADTQELTFSKLFAFYGAKGIILKKNTFKKNLGLLTKDGELNLLAQLLSDNSGFPLRVAIFEGTTKASHLFSVREFGYTNLLYSLDEVLRYGDVLNIIQADERNRVVERKEVPLFDSSAFREAVINAVLHNRWVDRLEPMITVFSDRIEILSRGRINPPQTLNGFFDGESVPVNEKLSEIFLQLHISEKSGRGVPAITEAYGKEAFDFRENSIVVKIPFTRVGKTNHNIDNKTDRKIELSDRRKRIIREMRNNPNITLKELSAKLGISEIAVNNNINFLKKIGFVERIGSNKGGFWRVK